MNTSSTWPSRTSTTAEPRQEARKPTASASASTKPSCRSSIRWRSANASTPASSSCRLTSIPGSPGTTNSDYIRGAGVTARRQCKPSLTPSHSPGRNQWPPDVGQTQPFRHQTGQLSDQVSATTSNPCVARAICSSESVLLFGRQINSIPPRKASRSARSLADELGRCLHLVNAAGTGAEELALVLDP